MTIFCPYSRAERRGLARRRRSPSAENRKQRTTQASSRAQMFARCLESSPLTKPPDTLKLRLFGETYANYENMKRGRHTKYTKYINYTKYTKNIKYVIYIKYEFCKFDI